MTAAKRPLRNRSVPADNATELATAIRADGRHNHVTVRCSLAELPHEKLGLGKKSPGLRI